MSIKIIGAGFPRTGTMTLKKALEILGYEKTYHYKDLIANSHHLHYWKTLEKTGTTDYERLFDGFQATVDFPGYPFYKDLLQRYPDAKVILTTRDVNAWYDSTYDTIWRSANKSLSERLRLFKRRLFNKHLRAITKCIRFMRRIYIYGQFDHKFNSRFHASAIFNEHVESVINFVPKAQLLVYDVSEGWEPLCQFLNCQIPNEVFPHLNKKEDFHNMVTSMINEATQIST